MNNNLCCPADPDMKIVWGKELQKDHDSLKSANIHEITELLKVLSNPIRLQMIMLLLKRDYCVCELVYLLKEKQNMISYNLGILKKHQIVSSYNRSKNKYYKLDLNGNAIDIIKFIKKNLLTGF